MNLESKQTSSVADSSHYVPALQGPSHEGCLKSPCPCQRSPLFNFTSAAQSLCKQGLFVALQQYVSPGRLIFLSRQTRREVPCSNHVSLLFPVPICQSSWSYLQKQHQLSHLRSRQPTQGSSSRIKAAQSSSGKVQMCISGEHLHQSTIDCVAPSLSMQWAEHLRRFRLSYSIARTFQSPI